MFDDSDPRHELWDTEEEEEEEEGEEEEEEGRGASPCSAGSKGSSGKETPEGGPWRCQDPAQWGFREYPRLCLPIGRTPSAFQDSCQDCTEPTDCSRAELSPWGRGPPSWGQPPPSWVHDIKNISRTNWPTEQMLRWSSRTLSHPSFQAFYTAVSICSQAGSSPVGGPISPSESGPKPGSLPLLDCSSFFYTDPTMPSGHRIYNWLSSSSQEVFCNLRLNTPAPVMATREITPPLPRRQELSELEHKAISALLELPASMPSGSGAGWSLPGPEAVEGGKKLTAPDLLL